MKPMMRGAFVFFFLTAGLLSVRAQEMPADGQSRVFRAPTVPLCCEVRPRPKYATGERAELCDPTAKARILLCSTERWCEAKWSPDSAFIAIEDHWDGQGSRLSIFEIGRTSGGKLSVSSVYSSPGENRLGVDWTLVRWDLKNGVAVIKRTRTVKEDRTQPDTPKESESLFKVPIR